MDMVNELGTLGLAFGVFNLTSAGISVALFLGFTFAIFFKPKH